MSNITLFQGICSVTANTYRRCLHILLDQDRIVSACFSNYLHVSYCGKVWAHVTHEFNMTNLLRGGLPWQEE